MNDHQNAIDRIGQFRAYRSCSANITDMAAQQTTALVDFACKELGANSVSVFIDNDDRLETVFYFDDEEFSVRFSHHGDIEIFDCSISDTLGIGPVFSCSYDEALVLLRLIQWNREKLP